ncbi:MAG: GNAT family N-acetyltransferase [Clostridiales bacterium]|nr:GNAT family N-acetyltransferase [Clostridiales bacterium]
MGELLIRTARPEEDAAELLAIYAPYVEKTAITFEYDVPTLAEFRGRMETILKKYPYLLAQRDGEILGYVYTHPFVGRAAYDWGAETTIYLREDQRRGGLGRKLYQALENVSRAQNILNLNACIGYPEPEDEYLTKNSAQFHAHLGYTMVGEFHQCGYKFGRWYNMVWMEKLIGPHRPGQPPVIPFPELDGEILRAAGVLE